MFEIFVMSATSGLSMFEVHRWANPFSPFSPFNLFSPFANGLLTIFYLPTNGKTANFSLHS